jgi:hypothetical protein
MALPHYPYCKIAIEGSMSKSKNRKSKNNASQPKPAQSQGASSQTAQSNKSAPAKTNTQAKPAKQRNLLLTIALILVILHAILVLGLFWFGAPETQRAVGSIALWLTVLSALGDVVAAVAMWFWKKWGIYLYGIATIAGGIGAMLATGSMLFLFGAILPAIVVLYIVAMQRNKFE